MVKTILDKEVLIRAMAVEQTKGETTFPKTYRKVYEVWRKQYQIISQPHRLLIFRHHSILTQIRSYHLRNSNTCTKEHASGVWESSIDISSHRELKGKRCHEITKSTC